MANKGIDEVRAQAGNVPNVDNATSSNSYRFSIRGETTMKYPFGYIELSHNFTIMSVSNCDSCFFV